MLKKFLVLIVFSFVLFGCGARKVVDEAKLKAKDGIIFYDEEQVPFTGKLVKYNSNGEYDVKAVYKNGVLTDGVKITYLDNGDVFSITELKNSKKNGKEVSSLGYGRIETNYINDIKEGEERTYDELGVLRSKINYKNNLRNGEEITYNTDGKIESKINYINDLKEGKAYWFNETGKVDGIGIYKNDKIVDGIEKGYSDKNGIYTPTKTNYKKGIKEGEEIEYNITGGAIKKNIYNNGKIIKSIELSTVEYRIE